MYERKDSDYCIRGAEKAIFWKNDSKSVDNFIVGVLGYGCPVLPDYPEYPRKGMNLKECRTIASLTNYINRFEMEHMKYFNIELQKAMEFGDKYDIRDLAGLISWDFVVWSLEEDFKNPLLFFDYIYVLKNGTVYVSDDSGRSEYPMNEYFVKDLLEDRKNFVIAACEKKCLLKATCTRSFKQKTLCPDAYNEIEEYVNKQLND